jgi:hypothetical protein
MFIKKGTPRERFTKVSNAIVCDSSLSDGAIRLYCLYASLPNGKNITDAYISKVLGITDKTITRRKKELKEAGLLLVHRLAPNVYDIFIGYAEMPAVKVKELWDNEITTKKVPYERTTTKLPTEGKHVCKLSEER